MIGPVHMLVVDLHGAIPAPGPVHRAAAEHGVVLEAQVDVCQRGQHVDATAHHVHEAGIRHQGFDFRNVEQVVRRLFQPHAASRAGG